MGVFDTVYFQCPHCGEYEPKQYKPGNMERWKFEEKLPGHIEDAIDGEEITCGLCKTLFRVVFKKQIIAKHLEVIDQ